MPPIAHAVSHAACRVCCWWATHCLRCRLCRLSGVLSVGHLLPALSVAPPVAHAVSHCLPGVLLVAPLVARAVGCATCCAVSHATCCAVGHATCCAVGRAACCSTCRMRRRLRHSLPMLPVALSVTPPVAPPVACAVCRATHSLCGLLCPRSHHQLRRLLLHLSRALLVVPLVACTVAHATCCTVGHAACCSTCRMRGLSRHP